MVAAFILRDGFSGFAVGHLWLLVSLLTGFSYAWAGRTAQLPGWQVICWSLVLAYPFSYSALRSLANLDWVAPRKPGLRYCSACSARNGVAFRLFRRACASG